MVFEMAHLYQLSNHPNLAKRTLYNGIKKHLRVFKICLYGLVMLLNTNTLLDTESGKYNSTLYGMTKGEKGDCISMIFACVLILGYLLVAAFESVTEIPGLANKMQRDVSVLMTGDVAKRNPYGECGVKSYEHASKPTYSTLSHFALVHHAPSSLNSP